MENVITSALTADMFPEEIFVKEDLSGLGPAEQDEGTQNFVS